jgi:hypothetical protein
MTIPEEIIDDKISNQILCENQRAILFEPTFDKKV